jgi:hypothetical protein
LVTGFEHAVLILSIEQGVEVSDTTKHHSNTKAGNKKITYIYFYFLHTVGQKTFFLICEAIMPIFCSRHKVGLFSMLQAYKSY